MSVKQEFINQIIREGNQDLLNEHASNIPGYPELLRVEGIHINTLKWAKSTMMGKFTIIPMLMEGLPLELVIAMVVNQLITVQVIPVGYLPEEPTQFLKEIGVDSKLSEKIIRWLPDIKKIPPSKEVGILMREIAQGVLEHTTSQAVAEEAFAALAEVSIKTDHIACDLGAITDMSIIETVLARFNAATPRTSTIIKLNMARDAAAKGNLILVKYLAEGLSKNSLSALYKVMQEDNIKRAYPSMQWLIENKSIGHVELSLQMIITLGLTKQWMIHIAGYAKGVVDLAFKVIDKAQKTNQKISKRCLVNPTSLLETICMLLPDKANVELAKEAVALGARLSTIDPDSLETYWPPMEFSCDRKNKEMVDYLREEGSSIAAVDAINEDKNFTEWAYNKYRNVFVDRDPQALYRLLYNYGYLKFILKEILAGGWLSITLIDKRRIAGSIRICKLLQSVYAVSDKNNNECDPRDRMRLKVSTRRWLNRRPYICHPTTYQRTEPLLRLY